MANRLPRRAGCDRDSRHLQQDDPGCTGSDRRSVPKATGFMLKSGFGSRVNMKRIKKRRFERAGWVVGEGDSAQFLKLSVAENRFIELKLALATGVRELRERRGFEAGRVGASAGIESVARRQDGSSRPLGVARFDHAVAPHHRSYGNRH